MLIQSAITEALEEEVWEILHGVAKQRFFDRVTERWPSTLQWYATQSDLMSRAVIDFHMKYENLDTFLISLNYYLGQQADLDNSRYTNKHSDKFHELPQTAPERSALHNFLTSLIRKHLLPPFLFTIKLNSEVTRNFTWSISPAFPSSLSALRLLHLHA
jgi:hypothetical protein